jgi:hypothetical protein
MGEAKRRQKLGLGPRNPRPTPVPFDDAARQVQDAGRPAFAFVPLARGRDTVGGALHVLTPDGSLHTLEGEFASLDVRHTTVAAADAPAAARALAYLSTAPFEYGVFDVTLERALVTLEDGARTADGAPR